MPGGELRLLTLDDLDETVRRAALSFGDDAGRDTLTTRLARRIERNELWGIDDGSRITAHGVVAVVDHAIGSRPISCQTLAGVAVAPEDRGQGHGGRFLRAIAAHGRDAGIALSLLFPASTLLYRRLGWEHAGFYTSFSGPTRVMPTAGEPLRRADSTELSAVLACDHAAARAGRAGVALRPQTRLEPLLERGELYVLDGPDDGVEAYAVVTHGRDGDHWQHRLELPAWAATTERGLAAVVALAGRHSTLANRVTWDDAPWCSWNLLLAEQDARPDTHLLWMARPLDAGVAFATRAPAPFVTGDCTVRIDDPTGLTDGQVRSVALDGGVATVAPTDGDADVTLHVRAVGPLLTGLRSADDLLHNGLIRGSATAAALLSSAYAGPVPHLRDFF